MSNVRYRWAADLVQEDFGEGVVVGNAHGSAWTMLNATGAATWRLLETPHTRGELVERLARDFVGDPATIARDVDSYIDRLVAKKLVRGCES